MRPLYERVLIKPRNKETTTSKGIMLPDKAVKRPNVGLVVACGEGNNINPMKVSPGDLVLCNRYSGVEIMYKGEKHYIVMSNEIIAILDSEEDISLDEFE
jgi:chaperonin GroES